MFKIDGIEFDSIVTKCKRSFEVADSDSSGRTYDWVMHRDVEGTFYNYNLTIESCFNQELYNQIYQLLSSPVESHTITMPYGNDVITFKAYVTKGSDEVKSITNHNGIKVKWNSFSCNFIAIEPYRRA